MFGKYFLGFLASRTKTVDNQAAWQKSLIFTEKKRKKRNKLSDLYTYVYF